VHDPRLQRSDAGKKTPETVTRRCLWEAANSQQFTATLVASRPGLAICGLRFTAWNVVCCMLSIEPLCRSLSEKTSENERANPFVRRKLFPAVSGIVQVHTGDLRHTTWMLPAAWCLFMVCLFSVHGHSRPSCCMLSAVQPFSRQRQARHLTRWHSRQPV
jgi:hypothetical protein